MYFLSESYQIVLDISVDTPGHRKYVVDSFNDVKKQYLAPCLRMCSTPEVEYIDSKCMSVDAMTKKVEVSFSE